MQYLYSFVLVICFVGVLSRSVEHKNINLLPAQGKCGIQVKPLPSEEINKLTPTEINEFPWLALLEYVRPGSSKRFSCTGVLISSRYVLTVAHCVSGQAEQFAGKLTSVRLGEYNKNKVKDCVTIDGVEQCSDTPVDIDVEEIIVHPNYNGILLNYQNDLAIIRLKTDAPYTDYIRPLCLPLKDETPLLEKKLIASGWDRQNFETKQKIHLPVLESLECQTKFNKNLKIELSKNQICAGGQENNCIALGGTPLMGSSADGKEFYLEGIESFGPRKCGENGLPDVFTKVREYIPWILDNIKA